jgi:hypothetical protein
LFLKTFRISNFNKHIRISKEVLAEISAAKLAVYYIKHEFFKKKNYRIVKINKKFFCRRSTIIDFVVSFFRLDRLIAAAAAAAAAIAAAAATTAVAT